MYFFVAPIMLAMAVNVFIFIRVIIVLAKATKNRDGWTDLRQVTVIASITGNLVVQDQHFMYGWVPHRICPFFAHALTSLSSVENS